MKFIPAISLPIRTNFNFIKRSLYTTKSRWIRGRRIVHHEKIPGHSYNEHEVSEGFKNNFKHSFTEKELLEGSITKMAFEGSQNDFFDSNPYETVKNNIEDPTLERETLKRDPKNYYVVLFPDFQYINPGMCKSIYLAIPEVRDMFRVASDILEVDIAKLLLRGPTYELVKLKHALPAGLLVSLALVEKAKRIRFGLIDNCVQVGYYGMGDLAALTFTGSMSFENAIRLSQIRGELMQEACDMTQSGLLLVGLGYTTKLNLVLELALKICKNKGIEEPVCAVAAHLQIGVKIIGGHKTALRVIEKCARDFNIRFTERVKCHGAYYTELMKPTVRSYREAVKKIPLTSSRIVISGTNNINPVKDERKLKENLKEQMCAPVKWEHMIHEIYGRKKGMEFPYTFMCGRGRIFTKSMEAVNGPAAKNTKSLEAYMK